VKLSWNAIKPPRPTQPGHPSVGKLSTGVASPLYARKDEFVICCAHRALVVSGTLQLKH